VSVPPADLAALRDRLLASLAAINGEVKRCYLHRKIYTEFRDEIVERHPQADGTFLNSYAAVYGRAQVMAIRRLADKGTGKQRPESLWWIIERLKKNPQLANKASLVAAVRATHPDAEKCPRFQHQLQLQYGDEEVVPDETLADMQGRLRSTVREVVAFADKHVAHRDPRGSVHAVTYGEIHAALDTVTAILNEVNVLLRSVHVEHGLLGIEGDWRAVFRPGLFPLPPPFRMPEEETLGNAATAQDRVAAVSEERTEGASTEPAGQDGGQQAGPDAV